MNLLTYIAGFVIRGKEKNNMTKIKLVDNTIINAVDVEVVKGILKITTTEHTVEELAALFSDKEKNNLITLMTESEVETGYKIGFTSFAGITYGADGLKTIELFQPVDNVEARIANLEGIANLASIEANLASTKADSASAEARNLTREVTDTQLAIAELAELVIGGEE